MQILRKNYTFGERHKEGNRQQDKTGWKRFGEHNNIVDFLTFQENINVPKQKKIMNSHPTSNALWSRSMDMAKWEKKMPEVAQLSMERSLLGITRKDKIPDKIIKIENEGRG